MRLRIIAITLWLLLCLWLAGLARFSIHIHAMKPSAQNPQAIVVMTGNAGRLEEAGRLLRKSKAPVPLLVSGVPQSVSDHQLAKLLGLGEALYQCCVTIGRDARNTVGNAAETQTWSNPIDTPITVVTSAYHMPRTLCLLRRSMPDRIFVPHPVRTDIGFARLVVEYGKFLTIWVLV